MATKVSMNGKKNLKAEFEEFKNSPDYEGFKQIVTSTAKAHDEILDAMKNAIVDNKLAVDTAQYAIVSAALDMLDLSLKYKKIEDKKQRISAMKRILSIVIDSNFNDDEKEADKE